MLEVRNTKSVSLSKTKLLEELVHSGGFGEQPVSLTLLTSRKVLVVQSCLTVCDPIDCRTVTHQLPPSMEFSRQEHWNELSFPLPFNIDMYGLLIINTHLGYKNTGHFSERDEKSN